MSKATLEYIWLDGYTPTANLRSKTKIVTDFKGTLEDCPMWSFDGSSTLQAEGNASDCLLKPVALYQDPERSKEMTLVLEQAYGSFTNESLSIIHAIQRSIVL